MKHSPKFLIAPLLFFLILSLTHSSYSFSLGQMYQQAGLLAGRPGARPAANEGDVQATSFRLDATAVPWQQLLAETPTITLERAGYTWTMYPRALYQLTARVLAVTLYDDWQANFAPVDLALGWGKLSDPALDQWIEWRQADRWYFYHFYRVPLGESSPADYVRDHSANVHAIPATAEVAHVLRQLRHNDVISLQGMLVDVEASGAGQSLSFPTSLSRTDSGANSCEIFYVERIVRIQR